MEIIDCPQYSEQWFQETLASVGGSSISSVCAKGQGKMRKNLLYRMAGEYLTGKPYEGYSNFNMERGLEEEGKSLEAYELITGFEIQKVGLCRREPHKHYSPDGLIHSDGIAETKSAIPSIHIERIDTDKVEGNYIKQMQWGLFICERTWCDFISYSPLVSVRPIWVKRFFRDEKLIKEMNDECDKFIKDLLEITNRIKRT